jgi:hypothetical protein
MLTRITASMLSDGDDNSEDYSHSTINSNDKEACLKNNKPPGYWDDEPEPEETLTQDCLATIVQIQPLLKFKP